jgi:CheY-like chemotaxis protein
MLSLIRNNVQKSPVLTLNSRMWVKTVLLINAEPSVREVLHLSLTYASGWRVLSAGSVSDGLQRAAQEQPDAIVLDLFSLSNDYLAFLQQLRSHPETQPIPVVVLTTGAKWLDIKQLQPFNVVGAIDYSLDLTQLFQQIATLLGWEVNSTETQ